MLVAVFHPASAIRRCTGSSDSVTISFCTRRRSRVRRVSRPGKPPDKQPPYPGTRESRSATKQYQARRPHTEVRPHPHRLEWPHTKIRSYEILLFAQQLTAKSFFRFFAPLSWQTVLHHGLSLDPRSQSSDVLGCAANASILCQSVPVHLPLPA